MKKIFLILTILIILILAATYRNNTNLRLIISNLSLKENLENSNLIYRINFLNIFPVGEAIFYGGKQEDYQGKRVYHLMASARPLNFVSKFFDANLVLDSFLDTTDMNPILFKQKIHIAGKKDINRQIYYDQKQGIMTIEGVGRSIPANTQDPLSAMFKLKKIDFDKIKEFEMNINTNQKNYVFSAKVKPKEMSINEKKYRIFILNAQIERRDKNPYHKSKIKVIFLKDKENLPLLIKAFANGFLINARLVDIQ
jgi:hypothetical protein